jgi:hypothetical protein
MSLFKKVSGMRSFFKLTRQEFRSLIKTISKSSWLDRKSFVEAYRGEKYTLEDMDVLSSDEHRWSDIDERDLLKFITCDGSAIHYEDFRPWKRYYINEGYLNVDLYVHELMKELPQFNDIREAIAGKTKLARLTMAYHSIVKYAKPRHKKRNLLRNKKMKSIYEDALTFVESKLLENNGGEKYQTISLDKADSILPHSTSAGYSYIGRKKYEVQEKALNKSKWMVDRIENGNKVHYIPCVLALRGHLSPEFENKSRCVWVMPYESVIIEASIFFNIYDKLKREESVIPFITGRNALNRFWSYINEVSGYFVSVDVSSWDASLSDWIMSDAFDMVKRVIQLKEKEDLVFDWVKYNLIQSRFMLPSGLVFSTEGGMPSGSYLTLLMNSICNWVVQRCCLVYCKIEYYKQSILGDDNSFFTHFLPNNFKEEYSYVLLFFFGLKNSPAKTEIYEKVHDRKFLGYKVQGLHLTRTTEEWFSHVLYPEKQVSNLAVSFTRLFAYFMIGGVNDIRYYEFFEYFMGTYENELRILKTLFDESLLSIGQLRVFKVVLDLDLTEFASFSFDDFLNYNFIHVPYIFTLKRHLRSA